MSLVQQAGLVNPQNAHFSNPGFSSKVGAAAGCGGSTDSTNALNQTGMYEIKSGGKRKGSKRKGSKRKGSKRRGSKRRGSKRRGSNRRGSKRRGRKYTGGDGFGFSKVQSLASTSGTGLGGSVHLAEFTKNDNAGINSDTNMGTSSQSGGYGTGGNPYYTYKPTEGEDLSVFAGSGYPPISRELNSQCYNVNGGKVPRREKV